MHKKKRPSFLTFDLILLNEVDSIISIFHIRKQEHKEFKLWDFTEFLKESQGFNQKDLTPEAII